MKNAEAPRIREEFTLDLTVTQIQGVIDTDGQAWIKLKPLCEFVCNYYTTGYKLACDGKLAATRAFVCKGTRGLNAMRCLKIEELPSLLRLLPPKAGMDRILGMMIESAPKAILPFTMPKPNENRGRYRHTLRLTSDIEQKLQEIAKVTGKDLTEVISISIATYHRNNI